MYTPDKKNLAVRLTPDDIELINEFLDFYQSQNDEEIKGDRQLFTVILESALSRKKPKEISKKEDLQEIEKLKNTIIETDKSYLDKLTQKEKELIVLQESYNVEHETNVELKNQITTLEQLLKQSSEEIVKRHELKENQLIITLNALQLQYIQRACKQKSIIKYYNNILKSNPKLSKMFTPMTDAGDISAFIGNLIMLDAKYGNEPLNYYDIDHFANEMKLKTKN